MLDTIIQWLASLAVSIVQLFPEADTEAIAEAFEPIGRLVAWVAQLNEYLPIAETLTLFGVILGVMGALYVVMFVRRIFSLIWPGAGS